MTTIISSNPLVDPRGYNEKARFETPLALERGVDVNATGRVEMPGWLYQHRAGYDASKDVIRIEGGLLQVVSQDDEPKLIANEAAFELNLSSLRWRKLN